MNSTCRKLTEREITLVRGKKILFLSELDEEESYRKKNMLIAAQQILQRKGRIPENKRDIDL